MSKGAKPAKARRGHNPSGRIVGYAYCVKCGLMYLKNEATRKAINASCQGDDQ